MLSKKVIHFDETVNGMASEAHWNLQTYFWLIHSGAGYSDPLHPAECAEAAQHPHVVLVAPYAPFVASPQRPPHRRATQGNHGNNSTVLSQ